MHRIGPNRLNQTDWIGNGSNLLPMLGSLLKCCNVEMLKLAKKLRYVTEGLGGSITKFAWQKGWQKKFLKLWEANFTLRNKKV